jgi:hypothetical protein
VLRGWTASLVDEARLASYRVGKVIPGVEVGPMGELILAILWCAWWLWCVNWKDAWPVLARGAWIVVVLFVIGSAMAWSAIFPSTCNCLGFPLPNFWWELGATTGLALLALLCGWVQGRLGWAPPEVSFEPPPPQPGAHGHH